MGALPDGIGAETRSPEHFQHDDADALVNSLIHDRNPSLIHDRNPADLSRRPVHALGFGLKCSFEATDELAPYTDAAILTGNTVTKGVLRFSSFAKTSWEPQTDIRGLAVRLNGKDGHDLDLLSMTPPVFLVRRADDFHQWSRGGGLKIPKMLATRQVKLMTLISAARFQGGLPVFNRKVRHLDAETFHGVSTFWFVKGSGKNRTHRAFRYHWEPLAPPKTKPTDLRTDLIARLEAGDQVQFSLRVDIAEDGATGGFLHDSMREWKAGHIVDSPTAGTLTLEAPTTGIDELVEVLSFNPHRLVAGVVPSEDEILHARAGAYTASHVRRQS